MRLIQPGPLISVSWLFWGLKLLDPLSLTLTLSASVRCAGSCTTDCHWMPWWVVDASRYPSVLRNHDFTGGAQNYINRNNFCNMCHSFIPHLFFNIFLILYFILFFAFFHIQALDLLPHQPLVLYIIKLYVSEKIFY